MTWWRDLVSLFSGKRARRLEALADEVAGYLAHVATLEMQIRETVTEVEEAVVSVSTGFDGMATRARASVEDASRLLGSEKGGGIEDMLGASQQTLDHLLEQIGRGHEISKLVVERMHELEDSAGGIVQSLAEIDNIAFGSKLVALNAKIEAAHLGELGGAFGVVANEISSHAERSEEIAERVVTDMQRMRQTVGTASHDLEEIGRLSVDTLEASRREMEGSLHKLTSTHQQMQNSLKSAVAHAEQLAEEIVRSVMALQFQDRVSQRLLHVADSLASLRATLGPPVEFLMADRPSLGERRRRLVEAERKQQYSMHAERAVIEQAAPGSATAAAGDDVELF